MSDEFDKMLEEAGEEGFDAADDLIDIDLSEAMTFEPFTAKVPVEIVTAILKRAQEPPHNPYIELKVRVFEGEFEGRILFTNLNLKGKGAGIAMDKLRAFGYSVDPEKPQLSPAKLIGLRANAACAPDDREEYSHKVVVGKITKYVAEQKAAEAEVK